MNIPLSPLRDIELCPSENLPTYSAVDLTQGGALAKIRLADQLYTLRITRAGKLILTK